MSDNLLIVEDDVEWRDAYIRSAAKEGFSTVKVAKNLAEAAALIDGMQFAVAFVDIGLNVSDDQNVDGLLTMKKIRAEGDETSIVVVTGRRTRDVLSIIRDSIMVYGAHDIVGKADIEPQDIRTLLRSGREAFQKKTSAGRPSVHDVLRGDLEPWEWDDRMLKAIHAKDGARGLYDFLADLVTDFLPMVPSSNDGTVTVDPTSGVAHGSYWSRAGGRAIALCYADIQRLGPVIETARSEGSLLARYHVGGVLRERTGHGLAGAVFALQDMRRENFIRG